MGYPVRQRVCLSRTRPCDDEQWLYPVLDSVALFKVKRDEMRLRYRVYDRITTATSKHAF